jgi:hypothetical protein
MKTSESITKIAPALLEAQRTMRAAVKDATNPHFKSRYADLATVIEATKGPLNEQGIIVLQGVTSDATGVMVETRLQHESGEWFADTLYLPVPTQTPQAYGSAITYGRRYGLQSMVTLPAEDDDGNKASEAATVRVEDGPPRKMKSAQFVEFCTAMGQATKAEALQKAFTAAILAARSIGDGEAERSFIAKKDELKALIDGATKREMAESLGSQP